jgi:hypothetical protein
VWSVRVAASIWIRCEGVGAPCAVSPGRPLEGAGVVGVGRDADPGECAHDLVAHGPIAASAAVGKDEQGGSASA